MAIDFSRFRIGKENIGGGWREVREGGEGKKGEAGLRSKDTGVSFGQKRKNGGYGTERDGIRWDRMGCEVEVGWSFRAEWLDECLGRQSEGR